ncbi:MAG: site-specific DNA-methyltransferase [Alphaproteobacteria bacterium]
MILDSYQIKKALGSPYYESDEVVLYQGDCIELMRSMGKNAQFNLTVTSPPYNIGKEYEEVMNLDKYIQWSQQWIQCVHDLTCNNGAFWLNLGYVSLPEKAKAIPLPYLLWDKIPFYLIQEIVWNYGAGVAGKTFLSPRNEKFLWHVKNAEDYTFNLDAIRDPNVKYPNQKKNGKLKCNPLGKNPTDVWDVWQIAKVTSGKDRSSKERVDHPAQFPIELISRIIKASSNPGDWVFDPFMGSGSTAVSALRTGRKAIGFEIRRDYLDITIARISNERESKQTLFDKSSHRQSSIIEQANQLELC